MDKQTKPSWISQLNPTQTAPHATQQHSNTPPNAHGSTPTSAGIPIAAPQTPPTLPHLAAPQVTGFNCELPDAVEETEGHMEALPAYTPPPELKLATEHQQEEVLTSICHSPLPNVELEEPNLPENDVVNKPWVGKLTVGEMVAFNNHVKAVMEAGALLHAANLLKLRGWTSPYVGLITSPDLAEAHIRRCVGMGSGTDIGGWPDSHDASFARARELLKKTIDANKRLEYRAIWAKEISVAREAWKRAIADRDEAMERLNEIVEHTRDTYRYVRDVSFDQWLIERDLS